MVNLSERWRVAGQLRETHFYTPTEVVKEAWLHAVFDDPA